jgi:hypothetical protein
MNRRDELAGVPQNIMASTPTDDQLQRALDYVRRQLLDGLRHGFFECTISCEIIKDRKRRLLVKAGKSEQFTIPADELER